VVARSLHAGADDAVLLPPDAPVSAQVDAATMAGYNLIDVALDAAGDPASLAVAVRSLHRGGTVYELAGPPPDSGLPSLGEVETTDRHPFNGHFSGTIQVSRYQKGKTNPDFTEVRYSEWQWHQLGHIHVCSSLQADNHTGTPPLSFFTGRMPFLPPNQQRQSTEGIETTTVLPAGSTSALFFSRPRSEGWPHHGPTFFSVYLCLLSF